MGVIYSYCRECDDSFSHFGIASTSKCKKCGCILDSDFAWQSAFMENPVHRERLRGRRFVITEVVKYESEEIYMGKLYQHSVRNSFY